MTPSAASYRSAERVLDGRTAVTIVAAMAPQQPDRLIAALLDSALARGIQVRLLVADTTGRFEFLNTVTECALAHGELAITILAGSVPRRLASLVDSLPISLAEIDQLLSSGELSADVFAVRMQRAGHGFELGNAVGYTMTMLTSPGVTVAIEAAPGGTYVPGLCPVEPELLTSSIVWDDDAQSLAARVSSPLAADSARERIAANLTRIVPLDATLQLGIGGVAEAVVSTLAARAPIGFHSGILPNGLRARLAAGDFTGSAKTADSGLAVGTSLAPDAGPHPWPASTCLRPLAETHSPMALARHERLWAINSAFTVDLSGQVNAEWIGGDKVACGAGQLDFARAAHASRQGAAVIALPARTSRGDSRIVGRLDTGTAITTAAGDVDYVVTEYGVARLTGRTLGERARALVAIAHPDDRAALHAHPAFG